MYTEIDDLDDPDLAAYFTGFTDSAWRLETLEYYHLPAEQASFDRFLAGAPDRACTHTWITDTVAPAVADGRSVGRVHVIERITDDLGKLALPDYLRFELDCYTAALAAGEDIRIAWVKPGKWPRDVWSKGYDFWLFDADTNDATLMEMHYEPDGTFRKALITTYDEHIDRARRCQQAALAASKPFRP